MNSFVAEVDVVLSQPSVADTNSLLDDDYVASIHPSHDVVFAHYYDDNTAYDDDVNYDNDFHNTNYDYDFYNINYDKDFYNTNYDYNFYDTFVNNDNS